jgi:hypothetical protein
VGSSRPSSLLYTYGPGAIMDLPQFTIMPTGLDDWDRIWRRRDGAPPADELAREIGDFCAAQTLWLEAVAGEPGDPARVRVRQFRPVPAAISLTAGDAAHNIRSALDHLAWAAVAPSAQAPVRASRSEARPRVIHATGTSG